MLNIISFGSNLSQRLIRPWRKLSYEPKNHADHTESQLRKPASADDTIM